VKLLEEELYVERQKNQLLEEELEVLTHNLEQSKHDYRKSLESYAQEIREFKSLKMELVEMEKDKDALGDRLSHFQTEVELFRDMARTNLEFIIKIFEIVTLMPETVEVDSSSNEPIEFSFEEKRSKIIQKNIFLETKIVKYLELNGRFLSSFRLESTLMKIVEEYEKKKQCVQPRGAKPAQWSPKQGAKYSPKKKERRSGGKARKGESFSMNGTFNQEQSGCEAGAEGRGEENNSSFSRSVQNSSGGKNNNYSININLVVTDNSDSAILESNSKSNSQKKYRNILESFAKELGCNKTKDDHSYSHNDSFVYSLSDPSSFKEGSKPGSEAFRDPPAAKGDFKEKAGNESSKEEIVRALMHFSPEQEGDMALKKGDYIKVIKKHNGWWWGQNLTSNRFGLFPHNFVVPN
jgi:hypothetical protein